MQTLIQYRQQKKEAYLIHTRDVQSNRPARQTTSRSPSCTDSSADLQEKSPDNSLTDREELPPSVGPEQTRQSPPSSLKANVDKASQKSHGQAQKIFIECDDDGRDQADPHNWPRSKRLWTTAILFLLVFSQGWVSTCESNVTKPASKSFHVSQTSETLATALFLFGISAGSLVVGPLSEEFGRNPVYLVSSFFLLCFTLGDALAPNFGAQITFRFLAGLFSSPALSIYGGSLADLWNMKERENLWPVFALSPLLSPVLSPVVGGWIADRVTWTWVYWIGLALSGTIYLLALLCLPETFSPMIIQWRTHHLRQLSGNDNYTCDLEGGDSLGQRLANNLSRPAKFFTTEPIIIALGFYLVVVYVVIFTFLNGFEFVFQDTYGISTGDTSLAFLGICIGALVSVAILPLIDMLRTRFHKEKGSLDTATPAAPEVLLFPAIIASPFFAISIFWLGWTNYKSISYWSGYAAVILFGYAMTAIFVSSYSYIINIYGTFSSSALGSVTMARYLVAAGMVVAARPMYQGIKVHWALTFLGCLGIVCLPVPYLIYRYGSVLRKKSQFISEDE